MDLPVRLRTKQTLDQFKLKNPVNGERLDWAGGQLEIADCIMNRSAIDGNQRTEVVACTQYGKSLTVGAALAIRASTCQEKWAIIAGTKEKARIIMDYVIDFSLNNPAIRTRLPAQTSLDRLKQRRSKDQLNYTGAGEIRVYSANATRTSEVSKALMGFGSPNIVQDESSLIDDTLQATVLRMLGGHKDNFLMKIGNPFNRGHFYKTWVGGRYYRIFIDYKRALREGRFTEDFIDEMREEDLFDVFYECLFPEEGQIDSKGWLPLLTETEIVNATVGDIYSIGIPHLGADVAGGGRNYSTIALRSENVAMSVYKKREFDTIKFGSVIINTAHANRVPDENISIDRVGVGKGVYDWIRAQKPKIVGFGGGDSPTMMGTSHEYFNRRAEAYWNLRDWILLKGGKLYENRDWEQLAQVKYKVVSGNKIKIMSKQEMLMNKIDSPDVADSLMQTFHRPFKVAIKEIKKPKGPLDSPDPEPFNPMKALDPYAR